MKIISWNLLRLTGASLYDVVALIEHEQPDVLLMQEATHLIDGLPRAVGGHYVRHMLPGNVHGQVLNRRQLRRIGRNLPAHAAVIGDFNMVGPVRVKGFRDVGPRQPTHRAGDLIPLRLDRCLVRGLEGSAPRILAAASSDHHPICITLARPASLEIAA